MLAAAVARQGRFSARLVVAVWALATFGCAGKAERGAPGGTGGTTDPGTQQGGAANAPSSSGGAGGGESQLPSAFGCKGEALEPGAEAAFCAGSYTFIHCIPRATYVVLEQSAAMAEPWGDTTRWQYASEALSELGEFGLFAPLGIASPDACDPANYASLRVLDGRGNDETDPLQALASVVPAGKNPILPALEGALAFARSTPSLVVILTATAPDECPSDVAVSDLVRVIAAARADNAPVSIAVVALGANYDVDPLARAAETLPFHIAQGDPVSRLVEALALSTGCGGPQRAECVFEEVAPPPGETLDPDNALLGVETAMGKEYWRRLPGPDACATSPNGGFYLDASQTQTLFRLCPCSCARMPLGAPITLFGCKP